MSNRPNLLFIVTDQQRADTLGMVQCGVEVTPNLNRLADRSTRFTRAYTTCPICMPARTALATGVYPTTSRVLTNDQTSAPANDRSPLQQVLHEAGYDVAQIGVEDIWLRPTLAERVPIRFVRTSDHDAYLKERGLETPPSDRLREMLTEQTTGGPDTRPYATCRTEVWPFEAEHFADAFFGREASAFLSEDRSKPYALFLGLPSPHPPLRAPEPFYSLFPPDVVDLPGNVGVAPENDLPSRRRSIPAQMGDGVTLSEWRQAWSTYLGLTHLADAALAGALNAAEEDANTVVVFTADHGDMLGQRRMYQKMEMYESALRVPLIVRAPKCEARTVTTPVSHLDVMGTVLELLSLPAQTGIDGQSFAGMVRSDALDEPRPVFAQFSGCFGIGEIRRAVVTEQHKYVYEPNGEVELFDLAADPLEMVNLAGEKDYEGKQEELHELCREWGVTHGDWAFEGSESLNIRK